MNVFISWSEDRSRAIGLALYEWLPTIIQGLKCWMSENNIDKGTRSMPVLSQELEQAQFGIVCLVPENLTAPWLLFEAGALSKSTKDSKLWTFLFGLEHTDVVGPLAQFQHTKANKEDVRKLVHAINRAQGESQITEQQLNTAFTRGWPDFEQELKKVPENPIQPQPARSENDLLKEILELGRSQQSQNLHIFRLLDELRGEFRGQNQLTSWDELSRLLRESRVAYGDEAQASYPADSYPASDYPATTSPKAAPLYNKPPSLRVRRLKSRALEGGEIKKKETED